MRTTVAPYSAKAWADEAPKPCAPPVTKATRPVRSNPAFIGATNAMRVLGKPLGIVAFLLDFAKGAVPTWLFAGWIDHETMGTLLLPEVLCGAVAVIGHCFPVYLGFKGGKGVATACGAVVAIHWPVFVIAGVVWVIVTFTTRYVSLGSIAMGLAFPITAWIRMPESIAFIAGCGALAALILVRHRTNVTRLIAGTETPIGTPLEEKD